MGRSQETFRKKDVRSKKEKKRKDKEKKKLARKENVKSGDLDDMIAYVDENGMITDTPPDPTKKEKINLEDIEIQTPKADDSMKDDPIRKGTVSYFNDSKGFGFIIDSETKERVFVHVNDLVEEIREGNLVTFEMVKGQRGMSAINVKMLK
ncbi:MAG: cold shock domain-containing protein [Bacteroidales bacterium]